MAQRTHNFQKTDTALAQTIFELKYFLSHKNNEMKTTVQEKFAISKIKSN